mmetsp:Transcript_5390/g.15897  ORF Transcript_5390/g.15897 Transcript_5390/m.15897 type:complete len:255 (-) Transcript_5390:957-1721(-)
MDSSTMRVLRTCVRSSADSSMKPKRMSIDHMNAIMLAPIVRRRTRNWWQAFMVRATRRDRTSFAYRTILMNPQLFWPSVLICCRIKVSMVENITIAASRMLRLSLKSAHLKATTRAIRSIRKQMQKLVSRGRKISIIARRLSGAGFRPSCSFASMPISSSSQKVHTELAKMRSPTRKSPGPVMNFCNHGSSFLMSRISPIFFFFFPGEFVLACETVLALDLAPNAPFMAVRMFCRVPAGFEPAAASSSSSAAAV